MEPTNTGGGKKEGKFPRQSWRLWDRKC